MLSNYIVELKNKSGLSYKALSEELNIKYTSLINMRDGNIKNVSVSVLEKICQYEGRDEINVLYDILFKDRESELLKNHSKMSLLLLCKLYMWNYSINDRYISDCKLLNEKNYFEGYAYRKRVAPNELVIDSWNQLVDLYCSQFNVDINKAFNNNDNFIYNVFLYAVGKFFNCTSNDIKRYYIIIEEKETYDIVKNFIVKGANTHVIPLLLENLEDIYNIPEII